MPILAMQEAEFQQFENFFSFNYLNLIVFDNKVPENVSFIIQKHCKRLFLE